MNSYTEIVKAMPTAKVICITADISDEKAVEQAMEQTTRTFGKLNFTFNNAGVMMTHAKVGEVDNTAFKAFGQNHPTTHIGLIKPSPATRKTPSLTCIYSFRIAFT